MIISIYLFGIKKFYQNLTYIIMNRAIKLYKSI